MNLKKPNNQSAALRNRFVHHKNVKRKNAKDSN